MTSPSLEVQGAVVSALKANAALMALVNGVWDSVPADPWGAKLAYVSLGPEDSVIDDADCIDGEEISLQIDVWSRKPGRVACKEICHAVKGVLHHAEITLTANALVEMEVETIRILKDPDQTTTHGVITLRIAVEEP